MQLNELIIQRNTYSFEHQGINAGAVSGRITFQDRNRHEVRLILKPQQIDKILAIVADSMVETTRELAADLTSGVSTTRTVAADTVQMESYATAIQSAITRQWIRPKTLPNGTCLIHIEQLPGGTIVSAKVDDSCPYDDQDKGSIENAVWSAQPLPYKGFENVFQRNIDVTFSPSP